MPPSLSTGITGVHSTVSVFEDDFCGCVIVVWNRVSFSSTILALTFLPSSCLHLLNARFTDVSLQAWIAQVIFDDTSHVLGEKAGAHTEQRDKGGVWC